MSTMPKVTDPDDYEPFDTAPTTIDVPETFATISTVTPGDTGWSVTFREDGSEFDGMGFFLPRLREDGPIPEVGSRLLLWGIFGHPIRGAAVGGRIVFYRTVEQEAERHRRWVEEHERKNKARYERDRDDLDRRMQQLPDLFRAELDAAIERDPAFRWQSMGLAYSLFALEQAVLLADHFGDEAAIDAWNRINSADHDPPYDYRAQEAAVPGWSDGHSGNTHGLAVAMAKRLVRHRQTEATS